MNQDEHTLCHRSAIRGPPRAEHHKTLAWRARRRNRGKHARQRLR